jgi:hypothetical protein
MEGWLPNISSTATQLHQMLVPAHVFYVHSAALAARLFLIATAVVTAAASPEYNHTKRQGRGVPSDWFPTIEALHQRESISQTAARRETGERNIS